MTKAGTLPAFVVSGPGSRAAGIAAADLPGHATRSRCGSVARPWPMHRAAASAHETSNADNSDTRSRRDPVGGWMSRPYRSVTTQAPSR